VYNVIVVYKPTKVYQVLFDIYDLYDKKYKKTAHQMSDILCIHITYTYYISYINIESISVLHNICIPPKINFLGQVYSYPFLNISYTSVYQEITQVKNYPTIYN